MMATHDRSQSCAAPTGTSFRRVMTLGACMGRVRCMVMAVAIFSMSLDAAARDDQAGVIAPSRSPASPAVETPAPGDHSLSMQWDGQQRTFKVHAPPSYDGKKQLPLVVSMHHYPSNADGIAKTSDMSAKADQEGFLVLYPEGLGGGMNALVCCGDQNDVGFVKALVDRMVTRWRADPQRVYATGISNGGDMAFRLAVEASGMFAAIAPVSGGFIGSKPASDTYRPKHPVSVISFIGGKDRFYSRFDSGLDTWQKRLGCSPVPIEEPSLPNGITHANLKCADGSAMSVYRLPGMGHAWPGAQDGPLADPEAGINATDLIWDFFKRIRRRG